MVEKEKKIIIFTDGSSLGNPGPGGWGAVIVMPDQQVFEIGGKDTLTTNNRMELTAAIESLLKLKEMEPRLYFDSIEIHTDSTYLKNGISSWVYTWEKNNWMTSTKESVLNQDLWQALIELARHHHNFGKVLWEKIKGHDGFVGNERADSIATEFAERGDAELFTGGLVQYEEFLGGKIFEQKIDGKKKSLSKSKSSKAKGKKTQAYSYVSCIDGRVFYDATWAECEKRVKGVAGAKYKKAMTKKEEGEISNEFIHN